MTRERSVFAATLMTVGIFGVVLAGSNTGLAGFDHLDAGLQAGGSGQSSGSGQSAPFKPILAGKKFVAPIKGIADVQYLNPVTKREKNMIVTRIAVKNVSNAPIARLTIDETWYGKDGQTVTGGKGSINGMLQPGEVQTVVIETPYDQRMNANNWNFTHANGAVKPHKVKQFEGAPAATKGASAKASAKKGR